MDSRWFTELGRLTSPMLARHCLLCGGTTGDDPIALCNGCQADLPRNSVCCSVCAQPLGVVSRALADDGADELVLDRGLRCGACLKRTPRFDCCVSPYRYAYPIDHLVQSVKFNARLAVGRVLSQLLARHLQDCTQELPQLVIPVPLAPQRFVDRGFNQAIELARSVETELGVPMHNGLVARVRETGEQATLNAKQRRKNIRGAFAMSARLTAKHVAIVDDVITTGNTVNELARVLKRAGAKRVDVWAICRAGR